jgi:hypothetical protein
MIIIIIIYNKSTHIPVQRERKFLKTNGTTMEQQWNNNGTTERTGVCMVCLLLFYLLICVLLSTCTTDHPSTCISHSGETTCRAVPCRAVRRKEGRQAGRQWRQLEENSNSTVAMKDIITMKYADLFVKSSVY